MGGQSTPRGIEAVIEWLVDGARTAHQPQDVLAQLCERLLACGLPLHRVAIFVRTLHPNVMGRRFLWRRGEGVVVSEAEYEILESDLYLRSPVPVVFERGEMTQAELAEKTGVTRQTINAIEQGKYSPSLEVAFAIAAALEVPLEQVFHYRKPAP